MSYGAMRQNFFKEDKYSTRYSSRNCDLLSEKKKKKKVNVKSSLQRSESHSVLVKVQSSVCSSPNVSHSADVD